MKYQTYDELISLVDEFRLEHHNLTVDELDKLVKKTFRIDQPTLRELDGVDVYLSNHTLKKSLNFSSSLDCEFSNIFFSFLHTFAGV